MKINGNKVNIIRASHKGANVFTRTIINDYRMSPAEETEMRDNPESHTCEIEFSDMSEVMNIIEMLRRFYNCSDDYIGEWEPFGNSEQLKEK
jgi:hypothetical protein